MTESSAPVGQWLPIETAPRDGTFVLLWGPAWEQPETGWRYPGDKSWQGCDQPTWLAGRDATHWMPLPSPPKDAGQ